MFRELKIVVSIILVFFIYGLSSFFTLGAFVTPFFFGKLILTILSFMFFLMNLKIKQNYLLFFCFLAMLSITVVDEFSIRLFAERFGFKSVLPFANNTVTIFTTFFIYFVFFFTAIFFLQKKLTNKWGVIALLALYLGSFYPIFIKMYSLHTYIFSVFLLLYFILTFREGFPEKSVFNILSALFLLQFSLDFFKYLF